MRSLDERKPNKPSIARSLMCKALVFVLCAASVLSHPMNVQAANSAKAKSMRLEQTEGDVGVTNITKGDLTYTAGMRLGSGDDVDTDTASYAWISLDDSKAIKVDEVSEVEVRQKGKNLEALLVSGNLYFNVTVPLKSDESMNIRTSTMATGIRGTCGWVSIVDGCNTRVHLLEGVLHCKVINPVDGQIKTVTIHAGEWADFTVYGVEVFDKNPELISTSDGGQVPVTTPVGTDTASGEKADASAATAGSSNAASGAGNNENNGSADGVASDTGAVSAGASETSGTPADTSSPEDGAAGTGEALQESEAVGSAYNERPEIPVSPDGESCDISTSRFTEDDIPGFVLVELVGDDPLIEKIYDQSGIDLRNLTQEEAEEKLAEKEAETAERMQAIREAEAAQESNISKDPVWERGDKSAKEPEAPAETAEEKPAPTERVLPIDNPVTKAVAPADPGTPSSPSKTDATPTQSAQAAAPTASTPSTGSPAPTGSTNNDPATQPGSSNTNTPNNSPNSTVELTMPQTATTVQDYLNQSGVNKVVLNPGSGNNTLDVDIDFTVPAGKNLTASAGVPVDVNSGKSAAVNGTANLGSSLANNGNLSVNSSHTLTVVGAFTNSGTFNNTSSGRSEFSGGVTNSGTFSTSGTLDLNSAMTTTGSFTISGGTVSADSGINATAGSVNINGGTLTSTGTTLTIAGAALTMDGGTLTSSGTALQVSSGSFTMNSGTVTSATTGQTVVLNTVANVHLNAGEIKNTGDGGAISVPANTDFHNIMTSSDDMHITAKTDNLLGTDVGKLDETTGTSYGFISVWGGTEFNGELFDPNTMHPLTLSAVISATEYDLVTISTPAFVKVGVNVPLTVRPKTGYQIDAVSFVNPTNLNSNWDISYTVGSSTWFTMPSGPVEIRVTASKINYQLTKPASVTGGTLDLSVENNTAPTTAQYGQTVNVTVEPGLGYQLKSATYTVEGKTATPITIDTVGHGSFTMPAANVAVNAQFEALKYNVTLNLNAAGDTTAAINAGNVTEYTYGTVTTLPVNVTRDTNAQYSYTFDGWFDAATGGNQVTAISATDNGDKEFYAHWTSTARTYNVTLHNDGGTVNSGNVTSYTYGTGATLPAAADMSKAATAQYTYAFDGWYTEETGGYKVTSISNTDTGDKEYYARWTPTGVTYTITYHENGGMFATTPAGTYTYGTTTTLPTDITKTDYHFAGWYTMSNPTDSDTSVTTIGNTETGNKEFYAKWDQNVYNITVANTSNGSISVGQATAAKNATVDVTVTPATGYKLQSLSYTTAGSATPVAITGTSFAMPAADVTISAEFVKETYNVVINTSTSTVGGTVTPDKTQANMGDEINLTVTPDAGYKLKILTYKATGDTAETDITSTKKFNMPAGEVTVTAEFEYETYNLIINNSGTFTGGTVAVSVNSAIMNTVITVTATPAAGYRLTTLTYTEAGSTAAQDITFSESNGKLTGTFTMPTASVTINAIFTPRTYAVALDLNADGDTSAQINGSTVTSYVYGTETTLPANVTRAAGTYVSYVFDGWYTLASGGTRVEKILTTDLDNKTYYAHWIPRYKSQIGNTVQSGTTSVSPADSKSGDTVTITITPPTGKVIDTVTVNKLDESGNPTGDTVDDVAKVTPETDPITYTFTMPACPISVSVTFKNAHYGVTLNTMGGVINTGNVSEYEYSVGATLPTDVTRAFTDRCTYEFAGWFTGETDGTQVTAIGTDVTGARTYYAHWTPKYKSNLNTGVPNGTVAFDSANTKAGDWVTITITPETGKELKKLEVYKLNEDNSQGDQVTLEVVTAGSVYRFRMPDCPITVNAEFQNATYNIVYEKNDGVINDAGYPTTYTYSVGSTLPVNVTKNNYAFGGWFTTNSPADTDQPVTVIGTDETGDKTFYAKWIPTYTATLPNNITGGTLTLDKTSAVAGDTVQITATPDSGYELKTLTYTPENGTATPIIVNTNGVGSFTMPAGNVTIDVVFAQLHDIDIYYSNGTVSSPTPVNGVIYTSVSQASAGTVVNMTAYPSTGYELHSLKVEYDNGNGWTTIYNYSASNSTLRFTMPNQDVMITAEFTNGSGIPGIATNPVSVVFMDSDSGMAIPGNTTGFSARADKGSDQGITQATTGDVVNIVFSYPDTYDLIGVVARHKAENDKTGSTISEGLSAPDYSFTMKNREVNVSIYVREKGAAVTSLTPTGGTITVTPANSRIQKVKAGETVTLTFAPNTGLKLNTVTLTGEGGVDLSSRIQSGTNDNIKTFTMPDPVTPITVGATFTVATSGAAIPLTMPVGSSALQTYLNMGASKITLTPDGTDATRNMIAITGNVTIPDGVEVEVGSGVYLNVASGGTLNIGAGSTVTNSGVMTNEGTISLGENATLTNTGTIAVNGTISDDMGATINNTGRIVQTSSATVGTITGTVAITENTGICGDSAYYYLDDDTVNSGSKTLHVLGIGSTDDYTSSNSHSNAWYSFRSSLRSIVFEDGVTEVGDYFAQGYYSSPSNNVDSNYRALRSVSFSDTVTRIGREAFEYTYISEVVLPASIERVGANAFNWCKQLTSVTIPDTDVYIGESAFNATKLTSVTIPASPEFSERVFEGCDAITTVTFADGRTEMGEKMFMGCTNLTSVRLPNTLETLPDGAFKNCSKLDSITLPDTLKKLGTSYSSWYGASVFANTKISELNLPSGLGRIAYGALDYMGELESITIPSGITRILDGTFDFDSKLTTVTILDSNGTLTTIEKSAFRYCYALESIYYGGTEATWNAINIDPEENSYFLDAKLYYFNHLNTVSVQYTEAGGNVKAFIGENEIGATQTVMGGEQITIVATPNEGYETGKITVTGTNGTEIPVETGMFIMPTQAVSINVEFVSWENATTFNGSTAAELQTLLNANSAVRITSDLTLDSDLTIGANKILVVDSGTSLIVSAGKTLTIAAGGVINNSGTLTNNGELVCCGTINNKSINTVINNGRFYIKRNSVFNNGVGDDAGRFVNGTTGRVGNLGSFVNNAGSRVTDSGLFAGNAITGTGTVDTSGTPNINYSGSCAAEDDQNAFFVLDEEGLFTVFGDGPMADYGVNGRPYSYSGITSINIEDGITRIGSNAFYGAYSLSSSNISIASTVTTIGEYAFAYCTNEAFTGIELSDNITHIEESAFRGCYYLGSVSIPAGCEEVGDYAFAYCSSGDMRRVDLAESSCSYGDNVFDGDDDIEEVHIPLSLTSVPYRMFYNCSSITDVYYPGSRGQWNNLKSRSLSGNDCLFNATIHCEGGDGYCVTIADGMTDGTVVATSGNNDITNLEAGTTVTLTVTPAEGYEMQYLNIISGNSNYIDYDETATANVFTFTMPENNVTVSAVFSQLVTSAEGLAAALADENTSTISLQGDITIGSDLTIPEGKMLVVGSQYSLTIASGVTLVVDEDAYIENYGSMVNNGTVTLGEDAFVYNAGSFVNYGSLEIQGGSFYNGGMDGSGSMENNGTIDVEANAYFGNYAIFENNGTINIASDGEFENNGLLANLSKNTINVTGTLTNYNMLVNGDTDGHPGRLNVKYYGVLTNNGQIENNSGSEINIEEYGLITNNASIVNNEGAEINNNGQYSGSAPTGEGELKGEGSFSSGGGKTPGGKDDELIPFPGGKSIPGSDDKGDIGDLGDMETGKGGDYDDDNGGISDDTSKGEGLGFPIFDKGGNNDYPQSGDDLTSGDDNDTTTTDPMIPAKGDSQSGDTQPGNSGDNTDGTQGNDGGDSGSGDTQGDD